MPKAIEINRKCPKCGEPLYVAALPKPRMLTGPTGVIGTTSPPKANAFCVDCGYREEGAEEEGN